jgi:hypothetical protein
MGQGDPGRQHQGRIARDCLSPRHSITSRYRNPHAYVAFGSKAPFHKCGAHFRFTSISGGRQAFRAFGLGPPADITSAVGALIIGLIALEEPHMLRLSAYPWSDAGNPARNISAKGRIRGPECPLQRRFLIQHNVEVGCGPKQRAVCDETPIAEQKSLAGNGNEDRDVHRISYVTVEAGYDEMVRRRNRRRGDQSFKRETRK